MDVGADHPVSFVELVVFEVERQRYAIPLDDTAEIVRIPSINILPKAPQIIEGVINVRGRVVPVLDVRARFRHPAKAPEPTEHLIVARAGPRVVALRVDRVLELSRIDANDVEDAKAILPIAEYVAGVAKLQDGLVFIHDLKTFLTAAEAEGVDDALSDLALARS